MLFWLTHYLVQFYHGFQVFHYLTLRVVLAALTGLLLSLCLGPAMIRYLSFYQIGQQIRALGPQSHLKKSGTPTMGGLLILVAVLGSVLLWGNLSNYYLWLVMCIMLGFGVIGWMDDYRKLVKRNTHGISARMKLLLQFGLSLVVVGSLYHNATIAVQTSLLLPFVKQMMLPLGFCFIPFACVVIVGASNAVNLTDGLDGLAIMPTVLIAGALGLFAYVIGNKEFSTYLVMHYVAGTGEIAVICGALVGAGLGFLWFNAYPAQLFMGDVGSLSLGAVLGVIAVIIRQELILFIMGGIFVIETLSVVLQVASFKLTGKRIFRMAPIHHHFELKGWAEPKIIVRFWIITVVLVLCGLATLKLR